MLEDADEGTQTTDAPAQTPPVGEAPVAEAPATEAPWSSLSDVRARPWYGQLPEAQRAVLEAGFSWYEREVERKNTLLHALDIEDAPPAPPAADPAPEVAALSKQLSELQAALQTAQSDLTTHQAQAADARAEYMLFRYETKYPDIYADFRDKDGKAEGAFVTFSDLVERELEKIQNPKVADIEAVEERAARMVRATMSSARPAPTHAIRDRGGNPAGKATVKDNLSYKEKIQQLRSQG
jgi:hypothetical protein